MKTSQECIWCFFRQAESAAALVKLSEKKRAAAFAFVTGKLLRFDFNRPPVVFGRTVYKTISKISGVKDPFLKEKRKVEDYLAKNTAYLEKVLSQTNNPLSTAGHWSCAANAIDFGAGRVPDVKNLVWEIKKVKLSIDHFDIFRRKLSRAKNLLFIGDNCGESFFDRLFIKEILKCYPRVKVFYAVRSAPIINDVLISDARRAGINRYAKVFSSGCDYPGIILSKTSAGFKKIYNDCEVVVSKGQGNFESLEDRDKDIFYLFKAKCPAVSAFIRRPLNSLLFLYKK